MLVLLCITVHYMHDTTVVVPERTASCYVAKECAAVSFCSVL